MTVDKAKLAPYVVFLGGLGYTLYPFLDPPNLNAKRIEIPEKLSDRWFNPKLAPASARDPFQARIEVPPPTDKVVSAAKLTSAPGTKPGSGSALSVQPQASGLKLGALVLGGRNPAAVINGKVYLVGEVVAPMPDSEYRWQVVRVREDGVDLADFRRRQSTTLPFIQSSAAPSTKLDKGLKTASTKTPSTKTDDTTAQMQQLREVLGPAGDTLTPLPPAVTESLGRLLGADLKNGNLGALEAYLGGSGKSTTPGSIASPAGSMR